MTSKKTSARRLAVTILSKWLHSNGHIDHIRDEALKTVPDMDERERALLTELVYGVVRNQQELNTVLASSVHGNIDKMQHKLKAILWLGLYQLTYLDKIPVHAAVDESVSLAKEFFGAGPAGLVNAVLRRAAGEEPKRPVDAFDAPKGPMALWKRQWVNNWGEEKARELIQFFADIPPIGLRRNLVETETDEEWHEILKSEGVTELLLIDNWPGYVYVKGVRPDSLPSFEKGITTAQDPAAGIAPAALDPQPGESVLDLCAALGGKTAVIWERMKREGSVLAIDRSMKRNRITREGLKRLGHTGVKVETGDVMMINEKGYDRVLIDVPCSGTGVSHRRPDLLIKRVPLQDSHLPKLQRKLLERAAKAVKPGGVLVYSTCTLEASENEQRVKIFERKFADEFVREELPEAIPERWRKDTGIAATWPPIDKVDGAFVVRWRRNL